MIGAGAAGLWTAICAAEAGGSVCIVSRKPLSETASFWAQGGLAAVLEADDSLTQHAEDTIAAGRGLCRTAAVEALVAEAPDAVRDLQERDIRFDVDSSGKLALGLEGGHTRRRIVHAGGSQTGRALTAGLAGIVARESAIEVREETSALALRSDGARCDGVITDSGVLEANAIVLATGGAAALWSRTTNPRGAIGAGPVLAHAAGADLADLEFCQFHPTALALPGTTFDGQLITEAVRGEGAILLDASGQRFTDELAPRDAVAAAILDRMAADSTPHVLLDLRPVEPALFPSVFAFLSDAGLSPLEAPVPVAPAAHYVMGGIAVDLEGRTSVEGLYAVGESACTGLHGANRLASNSLSECFVFGRRAAAAALQRSRDAAASGTTGEAVGDSGWRFKPPTEETRSSVWSLAGPSREAAALEKLTADAYPLASVIGRLALERRESRGGHRRTDHPDTDQSWDGVHLVLGADGTTRRERWS